MKQLVNKPRVVVLRSVGIRTPAKTVRGGGSTLSNFLEQLIPLSKEIYAITVDFPYKFPEQVHVIKIKTTGKRDWMPLSALRFLLVQLKICFHLCKMSGSFENVIFYVGASEFVLPMFCCKLLRKKTIVCATGVVTRHSVEEMGLFPFYILKTLERLNFHLADQVAVESAAGIEALRLSKFRKKISIASALYIDTDTFKSDKGVGERENLVAYIGRLAEGKGIENFIRSMPMILKERDDLEFLIGGDGLLFDKVKDELARHNLTKKVRVTGWIPHEELPTYLNKLKLLILPSYGEGLPGIVQEAMACGTPVLATPVGCLPDLIKDGETGFVLEDQSPECIAKNVVRALEYPDLEKMAQKARGLIEREYSYKAMVEKCKVALEALLGAKSNRGCG